MKNKCRNHYALKKVKNSKFYYKKNNGYRFILHIKISVKNSLSIRAKQKQYIRWFLKSDKTYKHFRGLLLYIMYDEYFNAKFVNFNLNLILNEK